MHKKAFEILIADLALACFSHKAKENIVK